MRRALLTSLLAQGLNATRRLEDGLRLATSLRDELVLALLPEDEWSRLSSIIFDGETRYHAEEARGLYEWEQRLIAAYFPKPPARLLIGGAGSGREARELAAQGYFVALLEPAPKLLREAQESVPKERLLAAVNADYAALAQGKSGLEAGAPYDAVILGWGSLSHLSPAKAFDLLCALRRAAPSGALLLSTIHFPRVGPKRLALRRFFGRLGFRQAPLGELFLAHLGALHLYEADELRALAEQSGYLVLESEHDPLSATWTAVWRPNPLSSALDTLPNA